MKSIITRFNVVQLVQAYIQGSNRRTNPSERKTEKITTHSPFSTHTTLLQLLFGLKQRTQENLA